MFLAQPLKATYDVTTTVIKNFGMLLDFIRRDFRTRYVGSMLGGYWFFIHPIALILIYSVIFSSVMRVRFPQDLTEHAFGFTIFLCAGILPWTAFSEMLSRTTSIFRDQANLIKKVYFPSEILIFVATGSVAITFSISLFILFVFFLIIGHPLSSALFYLPLLILLQMLFASGLGMALAVLNVFFSDISQMLGIALQVWFWGTPIVYRLAQLPESVQFLVKLNPFFYFTSLYQDILFSRLAPSWQNLATCAGVSLAFFCLGASMLEHFKIQLLDEI